MKRVLVTGASGFIGSHCLPVLADKGFEVHGVVPPEAEAPGGELTWHAADLLDPQQTAGLMAAVRPTHLLHLAWAVAPGEYWTSAENLRWLQSGLDLSRSFVEVGGRRSVMVGTCAEYVVSEGPLIEGVTPLRPATLYGASKMALHTASAAYLSQCGVSNAWGHIFYLYGPGEHPSRLVPSIVRSLSQGERFVCEHPNDVRDFLHVDDVAGALVALLDSEVQGDVNIASGEPTTIGELVARVADAVGRPDLVAYRSTEPAAIGIVANNDRLRTEVGWGPRLGLTAGLEEAATWLLGSERNRTTRYESRTQ